MQSLVVLIAAACITGAFCILRRPIHSRSRFEALVFVFCYCLTLGLALRFGGLTYPGTYFPNSTFLNAVLNGNTLFTLVGYLSVVVAGIAHMTLITRNSGGELETHTLQGVKWTGLAVAISIVLYGFFWAAMLQRLP